MTSAILNSKNRCEDAKKKSQSLPPQAQHKSNTPTCDTVNSSLGQSLFAKKPKAAGRRDSREPSIVSGFRFELTQPCFQNDWIVTEPADLLASSYSYLRPGLQDAQAYIQSDASFQAVCIHGRNMLSTFPDTLRTEEQKRTARALLRLITDDQIEAAVKRRLAQMKKFGVLLTLRTQEPTNYMEADAKVNPDTLEIFLNSNVSLYSLQLRHLLLNSLSQWLVEFCGADTVSKAAPLNRALAATLSHHRFMLAHKAVHELVHLFMSCIMGLLGRHM